MSTARALMPKYFEILEENGISKFLQCKNLPVKFESSEATEDLWKKHKSYLKNIKVTDVKPQQSLLDLKIEIAERIFKKCCFCERRCGTDRTKNPGTCKVKESLITSEFLHLGEENVLVPSHTFFFSGCTFNCVFCQNWDISQHDNGIYVEPIKTAKIVDYQKTQGSRNVNWVGGDPTPNLLYILKTMKEIKVNIPQVWNSNMYCSTETMKLLDGVIDVYLTDFKYGNNECAQRLSKVKNYTDIIKRNHKLAYETGELIIRHLVMPNHIECCSKPILKWISDNIPNSCVNIMAQYRPEYKAYDYEEISRSILNEEFTKVTEYAKKIGIYQI
jgi:putative pyruvate formate lyase activating enzyme